MPYAMREQLLNDTAVVIGASETDTPVTDKISITAADATDGMIIDITASSVTDAGADSSIIAKLQSRYSATGGWEDSKTVVIAGNDTYTIKLLPQVSGDQQYLPLRPEIRVVVSSGAGDAATISSVRVSRLEK